VFVKPRICDKYFVELNFSRMNILGRDPIETLERFVKLFLVEQAVDKVDESDSVVDVESEKTEMQVLYLIDQEIDLNRGYAQYVRIGRSGAWLMDDAFLRKVRAAMKKPRKNRRDVLERGLMRDFRVENGQATIYPKYNPAIIDIILSGRIELGLLINSVGGKMCVMNKMIANIRAVKNLGGSVSAYVTNEAGSAAACILEHADRRFVLEDSQLMWHLSDFGQDKAGKSKYVRKGVRKKDTREGREEMRRFKEFLIRNVKPEELEAILFSVNEVEKCSENLDNHWAVDGRLAQSLGLAEEAFEDVDELRDMFRLQFAGVLGIDRVKKFFAEKMYNEEGDLVEDYSQQIL